MKPVLALLEKVIWTYLQVLVAALVAADALGIDAAEAAAIAAIPAALTVIANGLPVTPQGLPFAVDLIYRTARTFATAFAGFLLAIPVFTLDYGLAQAAATAAAPAALAILKAGIATRIGDPNSAATLTVTADPAATGAPVPMAA